MQEKLNADRVENPDPHDAVEQFLAMLDCMAPEIRRIDPIALYFLQLGRVLLETGKNAPIHPCAACEARQAASATAMAKPGHA